LYTYQQFDLIDFVSFMFVQEVQPLPPGTFATRQWNSPYTRDPQMWCRNQWVSRRLTLISELSKCFVSFVTVLKMDYGLVYYTLIEHVEWCW